MSDKLSKRLDELVWGAGRIRQALATDGDRWVAFVRAEGGQFFARESFLTPKIPEDVNNSGKMGLYAHETSLFQQKLGRALLPWARINDPATLALLAVSHVTSLFLGLEQGNASLLDGFGELLEKELGVCITGQNRHETAAHLLASITVLDRIASALSREENLPLALAIPDNLHRYLERIQPPKSEFPVDPFDVIAERLATDLSPARITEFCAAFWNNSPNGGITWDAVSSLSDGIAAAHVDFLRSRLVAAMPLFEGFGDKRVS